MTTEAPHEQPYRKLLGARPQIEEDCRQARSEVTTFENQSHSALPKLLSPKELATYLRKSHAWVERARWNGTGPQFIKVGHHCFYREQDVIEWLEERQRTQTGA